MDPGRFSTSVCVLMVCLLGTTRLSSVGQCACPEIPRRSLTLPPEGKNCFNVSDKYRYTCIPGYVRKAGTSNLIKCNNHSQWTTTKFPLECIPHPDSTPTPPHIPDGSSITTAATNRPGTSTSHPTGRSSTTETTSSANMEEQSTSETKSTTTVVSYKTRRSTYSPSNHSNGNSSMKETHTETFTAADTRTIAATLSVVILLVSMSGIIFVLHRRRKRPIPPQETEEMQPMNNPS
ncbi:interleukin-15 receptor subunit alpha isoform X1 [Xiphophorus couchianus]|uniref:interleukin-15 receptor subunit alpha isoform X1 n=1 Tax=Xiphophorus couchianus TaxID=32473 RepID=UPI001015F63E|nr:interleukin-15 receptor subunit alpha isoform X1 [Xiphophorus couchianus]